MHWSLTVEQTFKSFEKGNLLLRRHIAGIAMGGRSTYELAPFCPNCLEILPVHPD